MNIETMDKIDVLKTILNPVMDFLSSRVPEGEEISADDLIDFFGLGIAAVIDNDSNLRNARDIRLASETVSKLIERRAMEFRSMQDQAGISWFQVALMTRGVDPAAPMVN